MKRMKNVYRVALCVALCLVMVWGALSVSAAGSSKGSAQALEATGSVQDHLDGLGTPDWFKITPTASQYYRFTFYNQSVETRLGISAADTLLNIFLGGMDVVIYDSNDAVLADGSIKCGYSGSVSLRLEQGKTYYIKLTSTVAGNYRLTTACFADVGANSWSGAEDVMTNGQLISSIDAEGDTDWFSFTADSEQSFYRFSLENLSGNAQQHLYLYEYVEGAGETPLRDVWNFSVRKGSTSSKDVQLKEGHVYYYRISGGVGGYQLNVSQRLDVAGGNFSTAYPIETDTKYTTSFDGDGDVDYFTFQTGDKDAYYHFEVDLLYTVNDYIYFRLYDAAGNEVGYDRTYSGNLPATVDYRLEPNSTYYFRYDKEDADLGNYTVYVRTIEDAHPNKRNLAAKIDTDQKVSASFDGDGDIDYFKFTTGADAAYYHFKIELLNELNDYVYLYVYDEEGNEVGYDRTHSSYFPAKADFALETDSTYYFRVSKEDADLGNYTVQVNTVKDAHPNKRAQAVKIATDKTVNASFDGTGDVDYFKFTTNAETAYYCFETELLHKTNGYVYFYLYDEAGNEVEYDRTHSSYFPRKKYYKLEPNTTYSFRYSKDSEDVGNYTVLVSVIPDPEGDTKSGAQPIKMNTPVTTNLAVGDDVDWFKFTVDYDGDYRLRFVNETSGTFKVYLYNAYDREEVSLSCSSESEKVVSLTSGTYYVKVKRDYGNTNYYTIAVAECGGGHEGKSSYVTKATFDRDGVKRTVCKHCGAVLKSEKVPRLGSVKLADSTITYTGKTITPTVKVVNANGKTVSTAHYTVKTSASGKTPGKYTVTITFKGGYSGSKKLTYTVVLGTPKVTVKGSTSGVKVSWKKITGATGYYVYVRKYSGGKWGSWSKVKTTTKTSYTHSASYGYNYQYRVKAYYKDSTSSYSSSVSGIRLKAPKVKSQKSGSTIKTTWGKVTGATSYVVYRRTYNAKTRKYGSWVKVKTTTARSYTDKSAKKGTYYQYAVKACKGSHVSDQASGSKVKR